MPIFAFFSKYTIIMHFAAVFSNNYNIKFANKFKIFYFSIFASPACTKFISINYIQQFLYFILKYQISDVIIF